MHDGMFIAYSRFHVHSTVKQGEVKVGVCPGGGFFIPETGNPVLEDGVSVSGFECQVFQSGIHLHPVSDRHGQCCLGRTGHAGACKSGHFIGSRAGGGLLPSVTLVHEVGFEAQGVHPVSESEVIICEELFPMLSSRRLVQDIVLPGKHRVLIFEGLVEQVCAEPQLMII